MSIASILTGASLGPWKIPQRGQNMLMNSYAQQQGFSVDYVITEGIYYEYYPRLQMVINSRGGVDEILFTSVYQLPTEQELAENFTATVADRKIHFALEGISGSGREFVRALAAELVHFKANGTFMQSEVRHSYSDFYTMLEDL